MAERSKDSSYLLSAMVLALAVLSSYTRAEDFAIENVHIISDGSTAPGTPVSLLVKNGVLEMISETGLTGIHEENTYSGGGGYILGQLVIGEPANFLILTGNPKEDFSLLIDTPSHTSFSVLEGEVLNNSLPKKFKSNAARAPSWLAYQPPPFSLPVDYRNRKKWNRFETKYASGLFVAAVVLDRQTWRSQNSASEIQVGDLEEFNEGEIRGTRLGLVGTLNFETPWVYTLFGADNAFLRGFEATSSETWSLFDWRLDIPFATRGTVSVGKQKEPLSLSRRSSGLAVAVGDERPAVVDLLLPARNIGIVYNSYSQDERLTWAVGAFNNWIDDEGSFSENSNQFIGRLSWLPYLSKDESNLLHVGIGMRYNDEVEGGFAAIKPESNLAPSFMEVTIEPEGSANTLALETSWRSGPFSMIGEYIWSEQELDNHQSPSIDGFYLTGNWTITGEMRPYLKSNGSYLSLPVAHPTSAGGWGALEVAARYSKLDLTDPAFDQGEMNITSLGVNWWLTRAMALGIHYRYVDLDQGGLKGTSQGLTGRLVLILD